MSSRHRRSGFTLIELLVVMAIIATLVGLLLPAVQKVREAAYRTKCSNNMSQLGKGLLHYESTNNYGFPGSFTATKINATTTIERSWVVDILPHIEQQNLYALYQQNQDWTHASNNDPVKVSISTLECPSALLGRKIIDPERSNTEVAVTDYKPITSVGQTLRDSALINPKPADMRGAMSGFDASRRTQDIRDGSGQTLLLVECAGAPENWKLGRLWTTSDSPPAPAGQNYTHGWARPRHHLVISGANADGTPASFGPCAVNCHNRGEIYSFHIGSSQALFADGHVASLKQNTNINVLSALVTRRGGETVNDNDYQ